MKKYVARFERDEDGSWTATAKIRPRETAVSDGVTLDKARTRIREAIAVHLDADESSFEVVDDVVLPPAAKKALELHAETKAQFEQVQEQLQHAVRDAASRLKSFGLPMREVGKMLGITGARVHQVTSDGRKPRYASTRTKSVEQVTLGRNGKSRPRRDVRQGQRRVG